MDKKLTLISSISAILLVLTYFSIIPFGKLLNIFLECEQIPENSFPCYGIYDIYLMFFLITVLIGSSIILLINLYKKKRYK
ncbi:MAG: hypothetical protein R6V53_02480 [Candidatus Woesearchaeota archaeon]